MLNKPIFKNKTGDRDPFDKKKLAEEAKKDTARIKDSQKLQEKNKLQLQIDNRQREMAKLAADLRIQENLLAESKRKIEDAKHDSFGLAGQARKQEGETDYLNNRTKPDDGKIISQKAELQRIKIKKENIVAEINRLKTENDRLEQEYKNLENQLKQAVSEKSKAIRTVQTKGQEIKKTGQELLLKKKIIEQLERNSELIAQEVVKLNREKDSKEKEINDLKRARDQIR